MKPATAAVAAAILFGGVTGADQLAVNPYQDKGTHHELRIKADFDQGERVEIAKDRAAMTIKGWNDEYAITVEPQIPTTPGVGERPFVAGANRPFLSKKMEYKVGDVTAFIEPRTDNEFDIDFTLDAKPDTNVFTYVIKGAEDFDFFYQPELTPEEIAEGASRPDNVVGSYAVYHKTKANHRVGSTNYATGKAFHIYRPKAIDANGAEVWAQLDYADGVLSVTVPQEFLNGAAYPVVVDPTFGYTTLGATGQTNCVNNLDQSITIGRAFNLSEDATLASITVGLDGNPGADTVDAFFAAYREDSGGAAIHDLVASMEQLELSIGAAASLLTITAASESLSADDYVLASLCNGEDVATTQIDIMSDTVSSGNRYFENTINAGSYNTRKTENPWTETATVSSTFFYSIYATYTAGEAPASSPTPAVILNGQAIINGQVVIQ